jgi:hypothetical protein
VPLVCWRADANVWALLGSLSLGPTVMWHAGPQAVMWHAGPQAVMWHAGPQAVMWHAGPQAAFVCLQRVHTKFLEHANLSLCVTVASPVQAKHAEEVRSIRATAEANPELSALRQACTSTPPSACIMFFHIWYHVVHVFPHVLCFSTSAHVC